MEIMEFISTNLIILLFDLFFIVGTAYFLYMDKINPGKYKQPKLMDIFFIIAAFSSVLYFI